MKCNLPVCHHCGEKNSVRKHGIARTGVQRFYCMACKRSFQDKYIYHSCEDKIIKKVKSEIDNGISYVDISRKFGIELRLVHRYISRLIKEGSI